MVPMGTIFKCQLLKCRFWAKIAILLLLTYFMKCKKNYCFSILFDIQNKVEENILLFNLFIYFSSLLWSLSKQAKNEGCDWAEQGNCVNWFFRQEKGGLRIYWHCTRGSYVKDQKGVKGHIYYFVLYTVHKKTRRNEKYMEYENIRNKYIWLWPEFPKKGLHTYL